MPGGMLGGGDEPLRMRHQAEDAAGGIAAAGHVSDRAVGIRGHAASVGRIPQRQLSGSGERFQVGLRPGYEPTFGMGHRQLEGGESMQEDAVAGLAAEPHPAIDIPPGPVVGQRGLPVTRLIAEQKAGLEQHLKPIADSDHETAPVAKPPQHVGQAGHEFEREDPAAGHVIAIGEASGDAENLIVVGSRRPFGESPHVNAAGDAAGSFEGMGRLQIAVGARGTEYERAGGEHLRRSPPGHAVPARRR